MFHPAKLLVYHPYFILLQITQTRLISELFFPLWEGGGVNSRNLLKMVKKNMYLLTFFIMSVRNPHISLNCSMKFCDCKFRT